MKQFIKTTIFVVTLSVITIYSKSISKEIIKSYNNCVVFMANNTVGNSLTLGV